MPGVLEGIKVVDLASMWATPLTAAYLADQGADVIKVEPPWGDQARRTFSSPAMPNGESRSWLVAGRGKRGIVVDISKPKGKEIVHDLVRRCDVVLTNFRSRAARRLGYDYDSLKGLKPGLIYVRVSAFGDHGPYADKRGYDRLFQAISGMMKQLDPGAPPSAAGVMATDMSAPWALCYGIALALIHREKTGEGQEVNTALLHMSLAMQAVDLVRADQEIEPTGNPMASSSDKPLFVPYQCSDGLWIDVVALSDKEFRGLCLTLEIPNVFDDPRFSTSLERTRNSTVLYQVLAGIFSTRPAADWLQLLQENDVPCAPILTRSEVFESPQVVANHFLVDTDYPEVGRALMINTPLRLSKNPGKVKGRAPLLGEHTKEVLGELGYSRERIDALIGQGVILQV